MTNTVHKSDLPSALLPQSGSVAIDTETMGLLPGRDRLCLAQLSFGDGNAHLVKFDGAEYDAPNLKALLENPGVTKIFHFARFDVAMLKRYLGADVTPIYCTKIASRLARTYTDAHGLKDVCAELLDVKLSKQQQSSDWGAPVLSKDQIAYAAADVLYLHRIRERLDAILEREGRAELARRCFEFLPARAALDLAGWAEQDIFSHATK
jgi:ribonuclease D